MEHLQRRFYDGVFGQCKRVCRKERREIAKVNSTCLNASATSLEMKRAKAIQQDVNLNMTSRFFKFRYNVDPVASFLKNIELKMNFILTF
jgi:hypothetical protein